MKNKKVIIKCSAKDYIICDVYIIITTIFPKKNIKTMFMSLLIAVLWYS